MASHGGSEPPGASGLDDAAAWVSRLGSDQVTRDDEHQLQAWLAQDPANAKAFDDHAAIFNGIGRLADNDEARAILMRGPTSSSSDRPQVSRRLLMTGGLAAAAAVTGVVIAPSLTGSATYATKPGEQRRLQLADGSTVMLNTNSKLRVRFDKGERRLTLDRGQAWFQVAKAPDRPFRVFVGKDEVRALGTAFDVRRDGDVATVTLEEGRVAIFRGASSRPLATTPRGPAASKLVVGDTPPVALLEPGQEARLTPVTAPQVVGVDLGRVQAWRNARMILDSTPLGDAVEDFNRYGGPQIVVADAALASLPVSGVFHTNRPEAFAESLSASFPIDAARSGAGDIVLTSRR